MKVITFYSYKGGVGRSLAAANFSVYLAKMGLKTVLIDFDLEAPGIDAKFPSLKMPKNQRGILDYILLYQQKNENPGNIQKFTLKVPLTSDDNSSLLWLIPSGQYLSEDYYKKLNQLDWGLIFSAQRDGVAFFQQFLAQIHAELQAEYVVIDSRTGITEIAGLCTQQLADEVVMLSSLSSESIKVTKHIKNLIEQSTIATALDKSIDVKIVVSRVPKPKDIEAFKQKCCERFDVEQTKLFFLFSCPILEQEEFLAISSPQKDEDLVGNYVRLFYGLDISIADENIRKEIERTTNGLLLVPPEEAEKRILELVALYQHPEVYRVAMRFFSLIQRDSEVRNFGLKLLDLVGNDDEAEKSLAKSYLKMDRWRLREQDKKDSIRVLEPLWQKGDLEAQDAIKFASFLEDIGQLQKSIDVALALIENTQADKLQNQARVIAARSAFKLGQIPLASNLIESVSEDEMDSSIALVAVNIRQKAKDLSGAFEIAKEVLRKDFSSRLLEETVPIARRLKRLNELEEALLSSREIQMYLTREPGFRREMEKLGFMKLVNNRTQTEDFYIR